MSEEENIVCFGAREYGRSYVQALNEINNLKQQLKDKDEKISKVVEHCFQDIQHGRSEEDLWLMGYYDNSKDILKILESE